jgi:phosphoribosyl-AMP cyclohydrolase
MSTDLKHPSIPLLTEEEQERHQAVFEATYADGKRVWSMRRGRLWEKGDEDGLIEDRTVKDIAAE